MGRLHLEAALILCVLWVFIPSNSTPTPQRFGSSINFARVDGQGDTNIPCNRPGSFVQAPDKCNRCYCELDGRLSSACSRAICPPGFPSEDSDGTRRRHSYIRFN